jgi:glycosyltransferase involved in cell wall biosynthesis
VARALVLAYTTYIHDGRVKRHAEALARRGDQVDAITLAAGRTGMINGVNVVGLEIPRYRGASRASYLKSYVNFFVTAARKAMELSRERPYDLAIVCTMPDAAILAALPLRRAGTKIVLDVHDTMPELYRDKFPGRLGSLGVPIMKLEERLSAALADLVLAVHEPHRQRLADFGIKSDKIRVVLNSPDDRIFVANGAAPKNPDTFTVVCHGTITHRMGLDLAVRAVDLLRHRIPQLRLLAVGAGDYLTEIHRLVDELKLQDRVIFQGMIPIEELPNVLRTADVGLVPNRESSATHLMLPVKLLEFAMMGIPAIAPSLKTVEYYFGNGAVRFF